VRQGLHTVLKANPDLRIVGEAGSGREAVRLVERLRPAVLVLDLVLPELNGLEVIRQLNKRAPNTRVVVLSMHNDECYVVEALKNGAAAYVLKDASADHLVTAVRAAAANRRYLSPPLSDAAVEAYVQRGSDETTNAYDSLTNREREVFQLAAEGLTNAEIGKRLFISPRTVEIHRANMMTKLGLRNQTELVRYAIKRGTLPVV
jgi:two-component system, NarL family, response regulator NreC